MIQFEDIFRGRKILITGHTGFKGSWLALWLTQLGAEVSGIALPPDTAPAHWNLLRLPVFSHLTDINDVQTVKKLVQQTQPELILHLAAQPLVRSSYQDPLLTWQTNVVGTANVLEACRAQESVRAIVVITTDKVYENTNAGKDFTESDPLGGYDPYSASKAACELVVQSYRRSFFAEKNVLLASARAGNVIGGGDWAKDRLIPVIVRAMQSLSLSQSSPSFLAPLAIRYPNAIRPWQHVLDSLSGYLCLAHRLLLQEKDKATAWNFGPNPEHCRSVSDVLSQMKLHWPELQWVEESTAQVHEAERLTLDSSAAQRHLGWKPVWGFEETAQHTAEWYKRFYLNQQVISQQQLEMYIRSAQVNNSIWVNN
jgi:CDP-glucose 4,6-dehydratase